jgi:hypothetical protein
MSAQPVEGDASAPALRLLPAPVNEPMTGQVGPRAPARGSAAVEAASRVGTPVRVGTPPGVDAPARVGPAARVSPAAARRPVPLATDDAEDDDLDAGPARRRTPTSELPDPVRWAAQFVQAAVEVAVGLRPAVQLVRWTHEDVYATLARRNDVAVRARRAGRLAVPLGRTRVRSVRCCAVHDGVVEASAVVTDGVRHRGVALRLEGLDGRWRVTAMEIG